MPVKPVAAKSSRLLSLDYLRGYFVLVIIVDHLWRFPSLFSFLTGQAMLWMTAAEGFVIISGFLIGYVRGFKGLKHKYAVVAKKLLSRATVLYFWMLLASVVYIAIEWSGVIASMPYTEAAKSRDWWTTIWELIVTGKPQVWVHFLYLYAVFLALAAPVVWLLRKNKAWLVVVLSIFTYALGLLSDIEWMKWQVIFFLPSVAGFYFETIRARWQALGKARQHSITLYTNVTSLALLALSIVSVFASNILPANLSSSLNDDIFFVNVFTPARVLLAFLWFISLAFLFEKITPWLRRHTFGVLEYVGTHSLTAYVIHGLVICLISYFLPSNNGFLINTLYGILAMAGVYLLIRIPFVKRILPK